MIETIYLDKHHHVVRNKSQAMFRLDIVRNPEEHEDAATKRQWKETAVTVRQSNFRMCQGGISTDFFHGDTADDTSIIFLLYFLARTRSGQHAALVGFALCDEEDDDDDDDVDTLYINALCANPDVRYVPEGGIKGLGSILLKQIEYFARDEENYTSIRLSALAYVINYYRRFGFRHVADCKGLRKDRRKTGNEKWVEKDKDILKAAEFLPQHIILGNVNTTVLQMGTPDDVYEDCRARIEKGKQVPGGFILAPGCELPPKAPPENVMAMTRAVNDFGWYD